MKKIILFVCCALFIGISAQAQTKPLMVGDKAPMFTLKDQNGKTFKSKKYIGKKIMVVYFYPKDETGTCTKEACAFRDSYEAFTKAGAMVVGINNQEAETHKKFAEHHKLPFPILSDPNKVAISGFGVKMTQNYTGRETFVVGLDGKIAYTFNSASEGEKHAGETLSFIKTMKGK